MRLTFEPLGIAMTEDTLLINWMENLLMMLDGSGVLDALRDYWFNEKVWMEKLPQD